MKTSIMPRGAGVPPALEMQQSARSSTVLPSVNAGPNAAFGGKDREPPSPARFTSCVFMLFLAFSLGCGSRELPRRVVRGNIACGSEKALCGTLRFVPIDGTPGPSSSAQIVDGQYRIKQWGGVPLGKHRVEVNLRRPTGKKIADRLSGRTIDETVGIGPEVYSGAQSPLVVEVEADGDGQIDLAIP